LAIPLNSTSENQLSDVCVIEGVPCISTETGNDCEMASYAMIYQYLGFNYSYHDLFYLCGAGYSIATQPKNTGYRWESGFRKFSNYPDTPMPMKPFISPGYEVSHWKNDFKFLSEIFGYDYNLTYWTEITDEDASWQEYWNRVKNYINQDMPVWAAVDGCCIPWWREHMPIAEMFYQKGIPGPNAHIIVLVGYNESNNSVCYNDMCDANIAKYGYEYVGDPNATGEYLWMSKDALKEATCTKDKNNQGSPYHFPIYAVTLVFEENLSKIPLSKKDAFELAHIRNLKKMEGYNPEVYDIEYLDFHHENGFGLEGIKQLKKDLNPFRMRLIFRFWKILGLFAPSISESFSSTLTNGLYYVAKDKEFASDSLLENKGLYDFCEYDGNLLKNESKKWFELKDIYENCTILLKNGESIYKIIIKTKLMNKILDEIIEIEEKLISEPSE
jgi:hypothetical protein